MIDLIIRNGEIIDGTGSPAFKADLIVNDGKIIRWNSLSLDGLKYFHDIDEYGVRFDLEFSFDGGKNYISKDCSCNTCDCLKQSNANDIEIQKYAVNAVNSATDKVELMSYPDAEYMFSNLFDEQQDN